MRYRFFMCKMEDSRFASQRSFVSKMLQRYLLEHEHSQIDLYDAEPFDVKRMVELLRTASGENAGFEPKFKFHLVANKKSDRGPVVSIVTEYKKAQEVADSLSSILEGLGFMLFDGEMDCCADKEIHKEERAGFVAVRLAYQRFMVALRRNLECQRGPVSRASYFKIVESLNHFGGVVNTAVSILHGDFKTAVMQFHDALKRSAIDGESVNCVPGRFIVEHEHDNFSYHFTFVVEGPGKCPMYMGWVEDGEVKLEMLRRMGIYQLRKSMSRQEEEYVRSRMHYDVEFPTRRDLCTPADRFVASYKLSRRLEKYNLDILYGQHPCRWGCGGDFCFGYLGDERFMPWPFWRWNSWTRQSVFTIGEEHVAPLLAIFESVVPYYHDYYNEKFHFRKEEVQLIRDRIKFVRAQILKDPNDPSLGKIRERLLRSDFAHSNPDGTRPEDIPCGGYSDEVRGKLLCRNRHRIVALLDFFSWWLDVPYITSHGFWVEGP